MKKSEIKNLIKETIQESENSKLQNYYDQIISLIRKAARDLNDEDAFELHEKLKTFFNKLI